VYQKLDSTYISLAQDIQEKRELTAEIEKSIRDLISDVLKEGGYN
jgi:hypothetical protein